jgi:chorismate dehydratase
VAAGETIARPRIPGLGIAAEGPVDSVLLFLRTELDRARTLALDPASRTSNVLTRVLLRARGVAPRVVAAPPADAELVIGDPALARLASGEPFLDLAAEWTRQCGLPFVFAAWYGDPAAAPALEAAYARGRERIAAYAADGPAGLTPAAAERYLRERIRFRIGPREEEGLARFLAEARGLGFL